MESNIGCNILKAVKHIARIGYNTIKINDAGITTNAYGKKLVLAGTIINETNSIKDTGCISSKGILSEDVNVTFGPAYGEILTKGTIDIRNLGTNITDDEVNELEGIITFLK